MIVRTQKGQLSVFLGISLLVVITLLAFVINVGLFVKAKINLQNAVDAAAWSGAAVQAKQLTTLAYLNWEMRNIYKEWMFKYYVLGQFSLSKTRLSAGYSLSNQGGGMNFMMDSFWPAGSQYANSGTDKVNIPSVCLHFGNDVSAKNICEIYNVPGIPRFETVGIPGVSELH
ncbi:MAG: Tad domain-containing protein, partial [Pseudomonadota bacterium]